MTGPAKKASTPVTVVAAADRGLRVLQHEDRLDVTGNEDADQAVESREPLAGEPVGGDLLRQRAQLCVDLGGYRATAQLRPKLRRPSFSSDLVGPRRLERFPLLALEFDRGKSR